MDHYILPPLVDDKPDAVIINVDTTPSMKPPWRGEGAYLTKRFSPSASTSRAPQSDTATFDKDKQTCFMPYPKDLI